MGSFNISMSCLLALLSFASTFNKAYALTYSVMRYGAVGDGYTDDSRVFILRILSMVPLCYCTLSLVLLCFFVIPMVPQKYLTNYKRDTFKVFSVKWH